MNQAGCAITLSDNSGYTKGPFTAFLAPYNKGMLVAGKDYDESFTLDPAWFPNRSLISWRWPTVDVNTSVRGFLAIDYGNYYNIIPEHSIESSIIENIQTLSCNFDLLLKGTVSGCNVIINFFLTLTSNPNLILFEIEVFLHMPRFAKSYIDRVSPIGTFKSASNRVWKVTKDSIAAHGPDILFSPIDQADLLAGTVDLKEMLVWLTGRGVITGSEFFNGLAIGVEQQQHDGTLAINTLSVYYEA